MLDLPAEGGHCKRSIA